MYNITLVTANHDRECGPTCLKMLLAYYGIDVPLETLIEECNTRLIGCSMADLMRVGRSHGINPQAYRMDAEDTILQDRPSICWWKYKHFIVCCGTDENGLVVLCDPMKGHYSMNAATFKTLYAKHALFNGNPVHFSDDYFGEHTSDPEYFDE